MLGTIAVIGGGPKAAALAAKVTALRLAGNPAPKLEIFEEADSGGHWSGLGGYTDGVQELCTPALRDLGFPYAGPVKEVDQRVFSEFSWPAFLMSNEYMDPNDRVIRPDYHEWVARGEHPPRHDLLSQYVRWALKKADAECALVTLHEKTSVRTLDHDGGSWVLEVKGRSGGISKYEAKRVVLTGMKPPRGNRRLNVSGRSDEVYDGCSYWEPSAKKRIHELAVLNSDPSSLLGSNLTGVIVGGGGTSAAIALDLARSYPGMSAVIVGSDPFIKSRPNSFWSDILHSDSKSWGKLSSEEKSHFVQTFVKGSVWSKVADELQKYKT